ncbi:BppU family phage baseplate upper protein [Bacillus cereus group sp. BY128LC]|uniref:BppU family phage baseplate upper protein n=3 Tax=unclassified Bacillus cereus group TaxID=2750818 RepID=UPI0022E87116|nr:BppU family phage baseplate upper protein [Bacillus cereus group sp. BY128LC]MDA1862776.1 BppU family phage baseplate upper protein [Bacillus cereus group sp. BY128LC]
MVNSIFKTYEVTVDTMRDSIVPQNMRYSQNDLKSAKILININHNGNEEDFSEATAVRVSFEKGDKKIVYQDCQPINVLEGKYQVLLTTQTLTSVGIVTANVHIYFPDDKKIETGSFKFEVVESKMSDEVIESTDSLPVIQKAIEAGEKLSGVDIPALVASKETAEQAKVAAEQNAAQIGILSENMVELLSGETGRKVKVVGGILRNDGTGFKFVDDVDHKRMNSTSVTNDSSSIRVTMPFTAKKIIALVATPDETYAANGFFIGASVGTNNIALQIYKAKNKMISGQIEKIGSSFSVTSGTGSGIGNLSWNDTDKILTINHDQTNGYGISIENRNLGIVAKATAGAGAGNTLVQFFNERESSGYIKYNGSTWDITNGKGITSVTFNSGKIVVNHDWLEGFQLSVEGKGGNYRYQVDSMNNSTVVISVLNSLGEPITAVDSSMAFFFYRKSDNTVPINPSSGTTKFFFSRTTDKQALELIDPNTIALPWGNIWYYGIFEI